jgi:uncharacterized protein YfaS (alpha-2-macroglobulin family)
LSNEALVWLTDLDTGKPISNVKINFYDGNLTWIGDGTTTMMELFISKRDGSDPQ